MEDSIIYVGLDVHKDTIAVALAEGREVRNHGKIANTPGALKTLCAKLVRDGGKLRFCYEAGPCGYGICGTAPRARAFFRHFVQRERCGHMSGLIGAVVDRWPR